MRTENLKNIKPSTSSNDSVENVLELNLENCYGIGFLKHKFTLPDLYWHDVLSYNGTSWNIHANKIPEIIFKNMFNHKINFSDSFIQVVRESNFFNYPNKIVNDAFEIRENQIFNKVFNIVNNLHLK